MHIYSLSLAISILNPTLAEAATASCYLYGFLSSSSGEEKRELANMIRLNFDAGNKEKCEQMMTSYCYYNVLMRGYYPVGLVGYFKPAGYGDEKIRYTLNRECKIQGE